MSHRSGGVSGLFVRPSVSVRPTTGQSWQRQSQDGSRRRSGLAQTTRGYLSPYTQTASVTQGRQYRVSSELSTMFSIKEKMGDLFEKCRNVIAENDTTPYIETEMTPVLQSIQKSYPLFHRQGVHYFQTYCSMQESVKKNQILSSASVRLPLQAFQTDWKNLGKLVDTFAEINPPPHAKEISTKFKAIWSSLDTIRKANERRKHPSHGINRTVNNVVSLGMGLAQNIDELFEQPYTSFQANLFEGFKRDVKSYLKVINEAFANEFVQSGMMICDLNRIKANILTDSNEIILCLKAAFIFPEHMKEIQSLKDMTGGELKRIIEKLSIPFVIIKPIGDTGGSIETQDFEEMEEPPPAYKERDEIVPAIPVKQDYLAACNRVDDFTAEVYQTLGLTVDFSKDSWENLRDISEIVRNLKEKCEEHEKKIEELKLVIRKKEAAAKENEMIFDEKSSLLQSVADEKQREWYDMSAKNKELEDEIRDLKETIEKSEQKYRELAQRGDATILKTGILESAMMIDQDVDLSKLSDQEMCVAFMKLLNERLKRPCHRCPLLEIEILDLKKELQRITNTEETSGSKLLDSIEKMISDAREERDRVNNTLNEAKKSVIEAIVSMGKPKTGDDLDEKTLPELAQVVLSTAKNAKEQSVRASQSFDKKEDSYVQALKRAYRKMTELQKKEVKSLAGQDGDKVIDTVDEALRSLDEYIESLLTLAKRQEEKQTDSDAKFAEFNRQMLSLFEIEESKDTFADCKAKLEQMKENYEKQVSDLTKAIADKDADMRAVELRISVVTQKKGTIYEMLNTVQDDREALQGEAEKLKAVIQEYQKCIELMADTVIDDDKVQEMSTSELITKLGEFCDNYDKRRKSVEFSELQRIFQKTLARNPIVNPGEPLTYLPPIANYSDLYLTIEEKANYVLAAIESGLDPAERDLEKVSDTLRQSQNMWEKLKFTDAIPTVVQLVSLLLRVGLTVSSNK